MGLIDNIKSDVKKTGNNKGKFIYFREGTKVRIRFLQDMDDGMQITFHDSFDKGINVPCQEHFGKDCPYCEEEGIRTRSQYVWSVWDYESKEVKLFMFPVNNCTPIPAIVSMYEAYGTLTDRDYVISVTGKQQNKTFSVVPMDKEKFRNTKAKPFSESAVLKMLDKAFPCEDNDDDDYEEEERPKKKKPAKSSGKKKPEPEEDEWDDEEDDTEVVDYSVLTAKELYNLCKERKIDVETKKPPKYYIKQLEEYDKAQDDWDEDEEGDDYDDDEWEE